MIVFVYFNFSQNTLIKKKKKWIKSTNNTNTKRTALQLIVGNFCSCLLIMQIWLIDCFYSISLFSFILFNRSSPNLLYFQFVSFIVVVIFCFSPHLTYIYGVLSDNPHRRFVNLSVFILNVFFFTFVLIMFCL